MGARPQRLLLPMLILLIPGASSLHVVFGAHNIPHPEKAGKGGEDAFFFDDRLGIFGKVPLNYRFCFWFKTTETVFWGHIALKVLFQMY